VDGIQFNDDEIIFVEIKTGKARLSKSQKNTKELVKQGKVSFVTFRVSENGMELHKLK
jgi:predicted Holliday junction resolvase-like endonuclease